MIKTQKTYTDEEKKMYIKERQAELSLGIDEINTGVQKVFESENWKNYLEFQSSFHRYSLNNTLWIWLQNPNATNVASFIDWKKKGRYVKKGEKGLKVCVPIPKKLVIENENGDKEEYIKMFFKIGHVFDVSQTEGKDIPTICNSIQDDERVTVKMIEKIIPALEQTTKFKIKYLDDCDGALGYCNAKESEIAILKGQNAFETLATLIHECSHALNRTKNLKHKTKLEKCDEEIIAEGVSYCVLKHFNLDTSAYSFEYVSSWYNHKKGDGKLLKEVLEEVRTNANILIDTIENIFN